MLPNGIGGTAEMSRQFSNRPARCQHPFLEVIFVEMKTVLAVVDEIEEEERNKHIDNGPLTQDEMLGGPFDYLDEE